MGRNWVEKLKVKGAAWGIPNNVVTELEEFVESAEEMQAQAVSPNATPAIRHRRDRFVAEMVAFMRDLRRRRFFVPPLNEENLIELGLPVPDTVRTDHINVTEEVDFVLEIEGIRQVHVRCSKALRTFELRSLRQAQTPHIYPGVLRSKTPKPSGIAGWHGAVLDWGIFDAPPAEPDDLTNHTMASRTPHTLQFTEEERGRTVYVALRWQNERGNTGPWSDIKSTVVP